MTEATCSIARLDRSQPPPGWETNTIRFNEWDEVYLPGQWSDSLAGAWDGHEAANDPPGLWTLCRAATGLWGFGAKFLADIEAALSPLVSDIGDRTAARAAAWAWYWRRVKLAAALDRPRLVERAMALPDPHPIWWPRCLAWPDEHGDEVERWLADGGHLPEVLRA